MRTRMYGGVRGRKTKVGGKPTFVFFLLDCTYMYIRGSILQSVALYNKRAIDYETNFNTSGSNCLPLFL